MIDLLDLTWIEFLQFLHKNMQIQEEPTKLILLLPTVAFVISVWFLTSSINFYKRDKLNQFQLQEKERLRIRCSALVGRCHFLKRSLCVPVRSRQSESLSAV